MKKPLALAFVAFAALVALAATPSALAQYHRHHDHGPATSRHCQTDYDHRPHYYHSHGHYHYCPGGGHRHHGHVHGGVHRAANYDPVVADIQRTLQGLGHYAHAHHQADGIYGPETAAAIRSFQRSKGVPQTGVIDASLLASLGLTAPSYVQPTAVQPIQTSTNTLNPAPSVPPGYKLVPLNSPKPVEQKPVVPDGYKLVPIESPTPAPQKPVVPDGYKLVPIDPPQPSETPQKDGGT